MQVIFVPFTQKRQIDHSAEETSKYLVVIRMSYYN